MQFTLVAASLFFAAGALAQESSVAGSASGSVSAPAPSGSVAPSGSASVSGSASGSANGSAAHPEPTEGSGAFNLAAPITMGAVAAVAGLLL